MLKLIDVKKDYVTAGSTVQALKGVSLRFRANEFVSILGASGCGKTTMLNIIGGLDHYTSGDLVISGKSTKNYSDRDWDVYRNHRIGFVFQSYNLIPHQTVLGNVEIALTIAGVSKEERKARAKEALEKVGLGSELYKRPNQLSGGQMQRVAIARALVNNPEILLADEPTGALDSVTSVQIMELIREIAGERLVIMVTHNPELAEQYSSRIVRLSDGLVVSDSNPYELDEGEEVVPETEEIKEIATDAAETEVQAETDSVEQPSESKPKKKKKEKKERAAMSFGTALALSGRNLRAKKGRTVITSIAGSIGIIGVSLVLALSNGFNNYILKTQEDMLSSAPVKVSEKALDVTSIMAGMTDERYMPELSKLKDKIYVNSFLTNMAQGMMVENDLSDAYLHYVSEMPSSYYEEIQYSYGVDVMNNLYVTSPFGEESWNSMMASYGVPLPSPETLDINTIKMFYTQILKSAEGGEFASLAQYVSLLGSIVNVMPGTAELGANTADYVLSQYDVIAKAEGSKTGMPTNANEAVLVIGQNNDMTDITLAQLGLMTDTEFLAVFENVDLGVNGSIETGASKDKKNDYATVPFERIFNTGFKLYDNDAVYTATPSGTYPFTHKGIMGMNAQAEGGTEIKITGILRLKQDLSNGCLSDGLNLTEKLVTEYIGRNKTSQIAQYLSENQLAAKTPSDRQISYYDSTGHTLDWEGALAAIGGSDKVAGISFYTRSFDTKKSMLKYLDGWNKLCEKGQKTIVNEGDTSTVFYEYTDENGELQKVALSKKTEVKYNDSVGLMLEMVESMLDAVTYVLVAFTSISLVVSSVMIGIITYVSVVERTKEIGVLRSLGARKKDIRHLFNAETFIIGLLAGLIGIGFTYLVSIPINLLLGAATGIGTLADLPILSAFIMVVISVCLTLISGLVPAQAAAKKDPVIALRTE